MPSVRNKTIWITGASSGIGAAVVRELSRTPCRIALTARREEKLDALKKELESNRARLESFPADVTDREGILAVEKQIRQRFGPVDILFTCAGDYEPMDVQKFDSAHYDHVMKVNYSGTLHCVEAVLPGMIDRRDGYLVIVSSVVGYRGLPNSASYSATKAALINFFEGARFDLKKHNVAVSLVNPGFVRTQLTDKNEFSMPFRIEPDDAARRIVAGMKRGKKEIHFPWQFTWSMKFLRILPYPIYEFLVSKGVDK